MIYLTIIVEFLQIGLFAIGGGLATIPFLFELSEKYGWYTAQNLTDMIAVASSMPGAIGVNLSSYAGYYIAGIPGSIIAPVCLVTVPVIIIILISKFLNKFKESVIFEQIFYGIRPAVAGLIIAAAWQLFDIAIVRPENRFFIDIKDFIIFIVITIATLKIKIHPVFYIIAGAVLGIVLKMA